MFAQNVYVASKGEIKKMCDQQYKHYYNEADKHLYFPFLLMKYNNNTPMIISIVCVKTFAIYRDDIIFLLKLMK